MTNQKYIKPSGSYISFMSNKVKTFGGINFAQGLPGFQPPKELIHILQKTALKNIHQYPPGNGNIKLNELIRNQYTNQIALNNDDVLITQGATEALSLIFTYINNMMDKKFACLAFDPVYESYKYLPGIFKSEFISFDATNQIDFSSLENTIKEKNVKILFLSSPGNPYGKVISEEDYFQILSLAEKYKFYILFDAVYSELYFETPPFQPLHKLHEQVFYINSFSKTLSITGWRIGYFFAHPKHMSKIKSIHDYTGLCTNSVLQEALAEYLADFKFGKKYLISLRNILNRNFNNFKAELSKMQFQIPHTDGGYFVWTKLPDKFTDGFKFAIDLYEREKVAIIPGEHFSEKAKDYIRINVAREDDEISNGLKGIKNFILNSK